MKLPIALALAGLTVVSGIAYGAAPEHATPKAIEASQQDAISVLPEQYKSYATKMNTVVKDTKNGYTFTIPWRVNDGVLIDMDVRSESEHVQGYSFNLSGPNQDDAIRHFTSKVHFMSHDNHGHSIIG